MSDTLREVIGRHESEITAKIEELRKQLAPLEGELADIRRARASLENRALPRALMVLGESPYPALTMKEMVLKALLEHFPNGATCGQFIAFFRDAWSRDIARSSLSPQLSRLRIEGKIQRHGLVWQWPSATEVAGESTTPPAGGTR